MYIYLLRHGETDNNKFQIMQGEEVDPELNSMGKKQSKQTGIFFHSKGIKFNKIISSPLLRAKQTANIVAKEVNFNDKILLDDKLIELKKGIFSGKTKEEVKEIIESNKKLKRHFKLDEFDKYVHKDVNEEEFASLTNQQNEFNLEDEMEKFIYKLVKNSKDDDKILLVAHGSKIGLIVKSLINSNQVPRNYLSESSNCNITVIKYDKTKTECKKFRLLLSLWNKHLLDLYK